MSQSTGPQSPEQPEPDTFILPARPGSDQPPPEFGAFSQPGLPVLFLALGGLLVLVACGAISGALYLLVVADDDAPETTGTPVSERATATDFVISDPSQPPTFAASATPAPTDSPPPTDTPAPTSPPPPTATHTFRPPSPLPPSNTPRPSATPTATDTASPTSVPSNTPLPTNTLSPSATPSVTPSPSHSPTPTPTTAQGQLVRLLYDQYSFYAFNTTRQNIAMSPLRFEAIDSTGVYAGYGMDGERWAQFYPDLEGGNCAAIEITQAPGWLRPIQCRRYNAILTPQATNRIVFWVERDGVSGFRVLWADAEIARCPVGAGECDIYVPQ